MERSGPKQKMDATPRVGSVIIGRNEGERLVACLSTRFVSPVVYVDSGSTDGSVANARASGATVVQLSTPPKFSAARARNAGMRALLEANPGLVFLQMTDGDCELRPGWIETAVAALEADKGLALVFGRRRERHPERSVYNSLCDDEWNVPIGEAADCGGDALFRVEALMSVGGYNEKMIAGEDSELAMRLRKNGWRLKRIDAEMTWHDVNILRFSQFWTRARRSGHAYAEMAHLHPDARWPDWPRSCRSIMIWGGAMPLALAVVTALALVHDPRWWVATALVLLPWPVKIAQLFVRNQRRGFSPKLALANAALLMVGKLPQFLGLASFHYGRWRNRASPIIEYKGPRPA